MAWTAPMTAVDNDIFTAAQFNTYVRDNFLQTVPSLMTAGFSNGSYAVKTGTNALTPRTPAEAEVATAQTTTSNTYTDLATAGPAVTVTTGTMALVMISCTSLNDTIDGFANMSVDISGATTVAASDNNAVGFQNGKASMDYSASWGKLFTGLTAGSNVFTAKYTRSSAAVGTATFSRRYISVIPF